MRIAKILQTFPGIILPSPFEIINLLIATLDEARLDAIVTAIAVLRASVVHLVALGVGGRARGSPQ